MNVYSFSAALLNAETVSLKRWQGRVLLIVNTASQCGFTPQYGGLQRLYESFEPKGLMVLGFPCNQFAGQEPASNAEIARFCQKNYAVSFPMFAKIDVNGPRAHPLFRFLTQQKPGLFGSGAIKWNFTKFLIDRQGTPLTRYAPQTKPESLEEPLKKLL